MVVDRETDIASLQRVGIVGVDALSAGVELVSEQVVVEGTMRPRQRGVAVRGVAIAAVGAESQLRGCRAAVACPKLHHAGHGVGAVQSALSSAQKLQAV